MRPTPLYHAYSFATRALLPVAALIEARKLRRAGLPAKRIREKRGHASLPRPAGRLVWFHAASVGESLSVLGLIAALGRAMPDAEFLITSGTATSAELVARRMPPRCRHQFAPLDAPGPLRRFLRHWRPDAAIFVESELWPQMLVRSRAAGIPLALINARLSERSLASWRKRPDTARFLLDQFALILTQNPHMSEQLVAIGADPARVRPGTNLKALSAPLPVDDRLVARMRAALGDRPVWVASSTHQAEEDAVLQAHAQLRKSIPDLHLVLAPRHPDRSAEIATLIAARGWPVARRSAGDWPQPDAPVFLADTLGELGSWYALTGLVFLGGSLRPIGGHNPFEVAQSGAAVLSGVHVTNFAETFAALEAAGGARLVADADDLARLAGALLADSAALAGMQRAARHFVSGVEGRIDAIAADLITALNLAAPGNSAHA